LNSWLTLDILAKRYSKLPSEVLAQGNTIDLYVMELSAGYEAYLRRKKDNGDVVSHGKSTDELQGMLERVTNANKAKKHKDD
jgi:hypothetical protein